MAMLSQDSATQFARAAKKWEPNDWWRLEARAWNSVPEVRRALAFFSPTEVWKDLAKNAGDSGGGCLRVAGHIIGLTAPTVMMFAMVGLVMQPGRRATMLLVAIVMLFALLSVGFGLIHDARNPGSVEARSGRILGMFHLVPSAISLTAGVILLAQGRIDYPIVLAAFGADVVLGALHLVVHKIPSSESEARWHRNLTRLKTAVDRVPEVQRAQIQHDLQGAFDELLRANLVPKADAERGRSRSLGLLGISMAPRPDLVPPSDWNFDAR